MSFGVIPLLNESELEGSVILAVVRGFMASRPFGECKLPFLSPEPHYQPPDNRSANPVRAKDGGAYHPIHARKCNCHEQSRMC